MRASLLYLILTGALGMLLFIYPGLTPYMRSAHLHLGIIGFFLSMVMGVAFWMMPRPGQLRQEGLEALTFHLLNTGIVVRLIAEPAWRYTGEGWLYGATLTGGVLQLAAMITFAYAMNARVKTAETIRQLSRGRTRRKSDQG